MAETTTGRHVRPDALNDVMAFDHVIRVHADGTVTEPRDVWAPEPIDSDGTLSTSDGWELVSGYTRQDGYRGPVMHPSESIGGRLARDILGTPGLWVAVVVPGECDDDCHPGESCEEPGQDPCGHDHDPDGWAVAHIPDEDAEDDDAGEDPDTCLAPDGHWYVITYGRARWEIHAPHCPTCEDDGTGR